VRCRDGFEFNQSIDTYSLYCRRGQYYVDAKATGLPEAAGQAPFADVCKGLRVEVRELPAVLTSMKMTVSAPQATVDELLDPLSSTREDFEESFQVSVTSALNAATELSSSTAVEASDVTDVVVQVNADGRRLQDGEITDHSLLVDYKIINRGDMADLLGAARGLASPSSTATLMDVLTRELSSRSMPLGVKSILPDANPTESSVLVEIERAETVEAAAGTEELAVLIGSLGSGGTFLLCMLCCCCVWHRSKVGRLVRGKRSGKGKMGGDPGKEIVLKV